ncbi:MAG: hypothetical protein RIR51_110, partial [Bacteroidota bacterium]
MKALGHLNKYFWKYKGLLFLGILFSFVSNFFGVFPAQIVRYALDLVTSTISVYFLFKSTEFQIGFYEIFASILFFYGSLIVAMAFIKGIFLFLVRQTLIVMSRHIEYDLKNEIYQHYQTLPIAFFRKNKTGDLMARISEDVSKVRMYVGPSLMYGMNLISIFILVIYTMYEVNAKLMWYVLLPLPILSISIYYVNSIIMVKSEKIQKGVSAISTFVQENFSGIRVIKSFVREKNSMIEFEKESENYRILSNSLVKVDSLFTPLIGLIIGFSTIIVVYIGSNEVLAGRISIGNITEFILYVFMLTWPVTALGWTTSQIQRAAASQKRINEFLNYKNDLVSEKNYSAPILGEWKFENVSFHYPDSDTLVLKNLSFEIKAGESIGLLGTTGSGKSTLAMLMGRFFDPTEGNIYLDGINLKDWDIDFVRDHLGYVPQEVFLFSTTIMENIKFGNLEMSDENMIRASKMADIHDNIEEFPLKYQVKLGERGVTLSGGQKQRVSIARALAKEPSILILDDCLSAVDTHTEHTILQNLKQEMKGKTTLLISHRVSTIKLAKEIFVLH